MNMQTRLDSLRLATRLGWAPRHPEGASEHARQEFESDCERMRTAPGDATLPGILERAAAQDGWDERDCHSILERAATTPSSAVQELLTTTVAAGIAHVFLGTPDPTAGLCAETDLVDWKVAKRAVLIGERLSAVARGAEFREVAFPGTLEETKLYRFGGTFFLDEMEILGDRTGFLQSAVESLSRGAALVRGDLVASVLLANADLADGVDLFHATHANLGVAVLDKTTLAAGMAAMAKQTAPDGHALSIQAKTLAVGPTLEGAARQALQALELRDSPNVSLRVLPQIELGVTDPRDATVYEGSATQWFLLAVPAVAPVLEMCFLQGTNRMPVARSWNPDRGQWGAGFSIGFDCGAAALDYRGVYKSTGAGA